MKLKVSIKCGWFLLLIIAMLSSLKGSNNFPQAKGQVFLDDSQIFNISVFYAEEKRLGHKTTQYYDLDNQLRLEEVEVFDPVSLELFRLDLKGYKSGREEEFYKNSEQIVIRYKRDSQSDWKEKIKKNKHNLLHGSMIVLYIAQKIKELERKERVSLKLLVPKYLTHFSFSLKIVDEIKLEGRDCYKIKMYASSWFLRQVVKPTFFFVEADAPYRLIKFKGTITPKMDDGKSFTGIATFSY